MGYSLLVLAHVIGLVLFAGPTIVAFFMSGAFWKSVGSDLQRAKLIHGLSSKFGRLTGIGILLLIVSGVGIVASTHGVVAEALWFKVKITLVILAIVNGAVFGGMLIKKLNKLLDQDEVSSILMLRTRFQVFYSVQLLLLAGIISLGVLKAF